MHLNLFPFAWKISLTLSALQTKNRYIYKQRKSSRDGAWQAVSSVSTLFAIMLLIFDWHPVLQKCPKSKLKKKPLHKRTDGRVKQVIDFMLSDSLLLSLSSTFSVWERDRKCPGLSFSCMVWGIMSAGGPDHSTGGKPRNYHEIVLT